METLDMSHSEALVLIAKLRSRDILERIMKHEEATCRSVADAATIHGRKTKPKPIKVSHATVGHLLSGYQTWVYPERAKLIERALGVPIGTLFSTEVSRVSRSNGRRVAA